MFQDYEDRRLPVRQNQNENPANPNPPREDPPAADGQGGGRGDDQRIPRADGAEPRQDNPLEQLIGNPLFQAMARAPAVNAVGNCRLPAFWRSDPDLWFLQVEAQFNIHQVTSDSTRFNMILTVLDPETISEVSDIIRAPPAQDKYTTLKDAIVARLTDSPDTQLHKLLGTIELGDKRSHRSFYCRCVRSPAHERQTTSYAYAGLTCCPTQRDGCSRSSKTRPLMSSRPSQTTSYTPSDPRWSAGNRRAPRCDRPTDRNYARSSLQRRDQPRGRSRSRTQPRSQSRPRSPTPHRGSTEGYCWYHERYGDVAEQCRGSRACVHTPRPVRKTRCADPSLGARAVSITIERRLYVTDRTHKIRFLIDSGSVLSILPRTVVRKPLQRKTLELQAANGTTIATAPGEMATIVDFPVQHRIVTSGQPVFARPRRLAGDRLAAREGRIQEAARSGHHQAFIEPVGQSIAPRAEAWKHLEDHGRLPLAQRPYSTGSTPSAYHRGLASRERRQGLFGRGSVQGVLQIPVAEEDISKTAVTTPFGLFEFVGMPLGLRNSAQTFQRTMNYLLLGDLDFVRCYQDDILVLSAGHEQHLQHLRELLTILKRARLFVNWEKCQIGRSEVVFAGYLISERGFEPPAAKVEAIARFPKPSDSTQLRRFIGMLNFYRRCLPRAAELMSPLTDLLRGLQKKKEKLAWSAQADEAFERIKQAMASAVRSAFYHPGQPLALHTDASNTAIGAALSQRHADDDWTPLGFFSQKLSPTQQRYSTYDRELLAIFEAIKYFQRILEGRSFTIMTDHRPLSFALEQKSDKFSPRQSRQLDFISRFDAKIVYTPGDENPSGRRSISHRRDYDANDAQLGPNQRGTAKDDEQLTHLRGKAKLKLHDVVIDRRTFPCLRRAAKRPEAIPTRESTSTGFRHGSHSLSSERQSYREASRAAILLAVDEQGHHASSPRISKLPHDDRPLHTLATGHPDRRHVCTNRSQSFFPRMDFIFCTPLTITTDQGAQFEGKLLAQLCKLVGAKHVHTSPYHPQANSMVERMHRTLKAALECSPETPWTLALPGVLLGLRTTFKEDLQASPAEMVFGTSLRIPGEFVARQEPDKTSPSEFVLALRRLFQAIRQCQRLGMFSIARSSSRTWQRATTCFVGSTPFSSRSSSRIPDTQSHPPHQRAKLCRRRKWRRQDALYRSAQASLPGCRRQRSITGNTGAANYHAAFINTESHLFTPCANCPVH
ncbi:unnamed protein product [Trichogramma brassicae]|uniref:RNA-directed DNA polymerase n=1 Tax=Trichogramma brassicae TaxID=86971 RepID=A0A6H5IX17_9HYME|nr:unnamed protein product [Trichogramma brassicae]